jgi:hypothetical protein
MFTLKKVNAAIAHLHVELIRGNGYFYLLDFSGNPVDDSSIYVYRLNHLSLQRWVETVESVLSRNL